MRICVAYILVALLVGCSTNPKVVPAELHFSLAYVLTHTDEIADGQDLAVYGRLYDGWLYLTRDSALARDIMSSIPVDNPYNDRSFRDSPCDAQFVQVFGSLWNMNGEWRISPTRKIEIPVLEYPRGATGDWRDSIPKICFEAATPPAA